MNTNELKSERIRKGRSISYMARLIGRSYSTWQKKEKGSVEFTAEEIAIVSNDLDLSPAKMNDIFFDSKLLFGNKPRSPITEL